MVCRADVREVVLGIHKPLESSAVVPAEAAIGCAGGDGGFAHKGVLGSGIAGSGNSQACRICALNADDVDSV
jgi:hypothetical protein